MQFTWLQLSNLRIGAPAQRSQWFAIQRGFFSDLDAQVRRAERPIDVIYLTGCLTETGSEEGFYELKQFLEEFLARPTFEAQRPRILAVPGPTDATRSETRSAAARALRSWFEDSELRQEFFDPERGSDYRKAVKKSFAAFAEWWDGENAAGKAGWTLKRSKLDIPGDFFATRTDGRDRVSVVGLNSAWLQLAAQGSVDRQDGGARFDLCTDQLRSLVDGKADSLERQGVAFLLTHHAPRMLPPSSAEQYRRTLNPPGRFAVHLCAAPLDGMPNVEIVRSGRAEQGLIFEGRALCNPLLTGERTDLRVGYSLGQASQDTSGLRVRIWPRLYHSPRSAFVPDYDYDLVAEEVAVTLRSAAEEPTRGTRSPQSSAGRDRDPSATPARDNNPSSYDVNVGASAPAVNAGAEGVSRGSLRRLISKMLITDSDFSAFCLDYFTAVYRRFSSGMDRTEKVSLLLELADLDKLVAALRDSDPERFRKHQSLLGAD